MLLLVLFGSLYTAEKEQHTLSTLRTQPIRRGALLTAKYVILLAVTGVFVFLVAGSSWAAPSVFGETFKDWSYPVVLQSASSFAILPVWQLLFEHAVLFIGSAAVLFALLLLLGTQLRSSFTAILLTGLLSMIGFVLTGTSRFLQHPWNPFQLFRASDVLAVPSDHPIGLYAIFAVLWSAALFLAAVWLREGNRGLSRAAQDVKPYHQGKVRHAGRIVTSLLFEWRKVRRQGLLVQCLLVLLAGAAVGYFLLAHQSEEKESRALEELAGTKASTETEIVPYFEEEIRRYEELIEQANEKGEDGEANYAHNIPMFEQMIEKAQEEAELADQSAIAFGKGDWGPVYTHRLYVERWFEEYKESQESMEGALTYFGYEAVIARTEWMQQHDVRPVFLGGYIPNIHDRWKPEDRNEQVLFEKGNREADHSGLFVLYSVFRDYLFVIPLVLLLYLTGAGLATERGKRPTLRLLSTLPLTRRSLFLGKVVNASVVSVLSAAGVFLFTMVIGAVFNRFGDWMYPVLQYHTKQEVQSFDFTGLRAFEGGYGFIPLGDYLLQALLLYVCITLFLVALTNSLGLVIRQPFAVYLLTALLAVGGSLLSGQWKALAPYSPFLYLDLPKILNGETATLLNNPSVSVYTGSAILLIWAGLMVIVLYAVLSLKGRTAGQKQTSYNGS